MKPQMIMQTLSCSGLLLGLLTTAAALLSTQVQAGPNVTVEQGKTVNFHVVVSEDPDVLAFFQETCPEISWQLTLDGTAHFVVVHRVQKGVHSISMHSTVHGIATDADGNDFVFSYANNLRTGIDLSSGEYVVNFDTDSFTMNGPGGHFNVGFVGQLFFEPKDDPFGSDAEFLGLEVYQSHGNVFCDPL
jgi:hypothetical protein